jgi:hypothetical protein
VYFFGTPDLTASLHRRPSAGKSGVNCSFILMKSWLPIFGWQANVIICNFITSRGKVLVAISALLKRSLAEHIQTTGYIAIIAVFIIQIALILPCCLIKVPSRVDRVDAGDIAFIILKLLELTGPGKD